MGNRRVFLDMDGVLVDFIGGALCRFFPGQMTTRHVVFDNLMKAWPKGEGLDGIFSLLGIDEDAFWGKIREGGTLFWRQLGPHQWAYNLVSLCETIGDIMILSSPARGGDSAHGKLLWLEDKLCQYKRNFILTPKKYKHWVARDGDILIDDDPRTCKRWGKAGGIPILFPRPWNSSDGWEDPMPYIEDRLSDFIPKKEVTPDG